MDKLRSLRTFVAIAEAPSMSAAAERLRTSLQSVMRSLSSLEAALGIRLIHRTTRRLSLTVEGRSYLASVRQILADLDAADEELRVGQATPRGDLAVSAPVLLGQMHVAPIVAEFLEQHPDVNVKLLFTDRVCNLVEEGVDVAIRIGALPDSTLVARPLGQLRYVVVASPKFLRANGTPSHPNELGHANCLRYSGPHAKNWSFCVDRRETIVAVGGNLESEFVAPLLEACARGLGFARVQSYQAAPYLVEKRLRVVLSSYETTAHEINILYPNRRLVPARVRAFVDWATEKLPPRLSAA
jgi:DNA-binding transcriptional LysR family regulator